MKVEPNAMTQLILPIYFGERVVEKGLSARNRWTLLLPSSMARVNQHPSWYFHHFVQGLSVAILSPKNNRFELRDPNLVVVQSVAYSWHLEII